MSTKTDRFGKFVRGFGFAAQGVIYCLIHERNMRFHIGAGAAAAALAFIAELSAAEKAAVFICTGLVIAFECVNTAIEVTLDSVFGMQKREFIRITKDCTAGAVLVSAVASLAVGAVLFIRKQSLDKITAFFAERPWVSARPNISGG